MRAVKPLPVERARRVSIPALAEAQRVAPGVRQARLLAPDSLAGLVRAAPPGAAAAEAVPVELVEQARQPAMEASASRRTSSLPDRSSDTAAAEAVRAFPAPPVLVWTEERQAVPPMAREPMEQSTRVAAVRAVEIPETVALAVQVS